MELALTQSEKDSALGQKILAHCREKLQQSRVKNDGRMSQEDRDGLTAKIRELKAVIKAFETDVIANPTGGLIKDVELPEQ